MKSETCENVAVQFSFFLVITFPSVSLWLYGVMAVIAHGGSCFLVLFFIFIAVSLLPEDNLTSTSLLIWCILTVVFDGKLQN